MRTLYIARIGEREDAESRNRVDPQLRFREYRLYRKIPSALKCTSLSRVCARTSDIHSRQRSRELVQTPEIVASFRNVECGLPRARGRTRSRMQRSLRS